MTKRKKDNVSSSDNERNDLNYSNPNTEQLNAEVTGNSENNDSALRKDSDIEQASKSELPTDISPQRAHDVDYDRRTNDKKLNSIFSNEELTSDDEIYTFQCPEKYIKEILYNQSIDFANTKQTLIRDSESYQLEFFKPQKEVITLAIPKGTSSSLKVLPVKGHIVLQNVVEIPVYDFKNENNISSNHRVIFPDDIKVRHPLLGVNWKTHIDLANKSIKKDSSLKKKNKKARKEKVSEIKVLEPNSLKKENQSEILVPLKKKRIS